jgi:hypothetical protein
VPRALTFLTTLSCAGALACSSEAAPPAIAAPGWTLVAEGLDSALMSVWGTSDHDVWAVGSDRGTGPLVEHFDGNAFERLDSGASGHLWWVFGFEDGPVFFGGAGGTILRYADGAFSRMATPSDDVTVLGLWGTSPESMWAVGGAEGGGAAAFAWRLDDERWVPAADFPSELGASHALWKVWGSADDDVWLVGTGGVAVHYDGAGFTTQNVGGGESLFTVHYAAGRFVAVGGGGTGLVFENDGAGWQRVDAADLSGLVGVRVLDAEHAVAVGRFGAFVEERAGSWVEAEGNVGMETLHSVWSDPAGGLWAVGGQLDVEPPTRGVLAYCGTHAPRAEVK